MERIAIILRRSHAVNHFRNIILRSFQADGFDHMLLCSGFFQDRAAYAASSCFKAATPMYPCQKQIVTVGLYNAIWRADYDSFTAGLATMKCPCGKGLNVEKRKVKRNHWHAKVFIVSEANSPQLGIIGSSNVTSRAFGNNSQWNYEADVVLWNDAHKEAKRVMASVFDGANNNDDPYSVIVSNYAVEDRINRGLSLELRLKQLASEIVELSDAVE